MTTEAVYRQNNVVISDDLIISPNLISQARFSYTLNYYASTDTDTLSWADWGSKLVLGALPPRPPNSSSRARGLGGSRRSGKRHHAAEHLGRFGADYLGSRRHNIRAGVGYQWNHFLETGNWLGAGQVNFTGAYTGNSIADLELGMAATFRQNNGLDPQLPTVQLLRFCPGQLESVRRLTLDLGLRWELNPPYTSADNALGGFEFGVQSKVFPPRRWGWCSREIRAFPTGSRRPGIRISPRVSVLLTIYSGTAKRRYGRLRHLLCCRHGEPGFQSAESALYCRHHDQRHEESGRSLGGVWRQSISL